MKEPKVSVIIPCKGRLEHLKESLPTVLNQTYPKLEIIVVDYNCPDKTSEWIVENITDERVKCVEAKVKKNEWNLSKARNKGYYHSTGDILLFLDADAILQPDFIERCLERLVEGSFLCGHGSYDACGCCMLWRVAFEHKDIRGYNELLQDWGYEDIDLYNRLERVLCIERRGWTRGIRTIPHSDEIRTQYQAEKNKDKTNIANGRIAKSGQFKGLKETFSLARIKEQLRNAH